MNKVKQDAVTDKALEEILRQAGPRPAPAESDISAARHALHAEWKQATRLRKRQRYFAAFAAAAAAVLALAVSVNLLQAPQAEEVVAQIDRSTGSIFVLGDSNELRLRDDVASLMAGEAIRTGDKAAVGLQLTSGLSLRVDENTSLRFMSGNDVQLNQGRIYVDSNPGPLSQDGDHDMALTIHTPFGAVRHVGTQYITEVQSQKLVVSVREGRVLFEHDSALAGEQLVSDGLETRRSRVAKHGLLWQWTEALAPRFDVDQRTADEFLAWVSRETGLSIEYVDAETEDNAAATILSGTIKAPPREALRAWVLAADYTLNIDETDGVIRIGKR